MHTLDLFSLKGKTGIVTGGEGLLGKMICETIRELGGRAVSVDIKDAAEWRIDIRSQAAVLKMVNSIPSIDILVNAVVGNQAPVETPLMGYHFDVETGLGAAAIVTELCGPKLQAAKGVVLNIGSDLSFVAPDQELYAAGVKPLSYSVVKHGIIGMTRYYAGLWGARGVRVNCLCPGSIDQGQTVPRSPLDRLAHLDEMRGPVAFMISEASSYMTGACVVVDGGRTAV